MSRLITLVLVFFSTCISAQDEPLFVAKFTAEQLRAAPAKLIPFPREINWTGEHIALESLELRNAASAAPGLRKELTRMLQAHDVALRDGANLSCEFVTDTSLGKEGYAIAISATGIQLTAATEAGHFYALQTLRQLIQERGGQTVLPLCEIQDAPAFPVRGFMVDVGRNFQPLESLKRQLDIMARYKLNVFQWHLTDRPAWRIESKKYPELNATENHRPTRDPGMYYTYAEIRELISYAKERHISVIPEIDMPGHSDSFTAAMGVRMETDRGMEILEDILTEFFTEIPAADCPIIHIGSDEVEVPNPKEFMNRMIDFCEANGREVMVWNPGLTAKPGVIRQTWKPLPPSDTDYREIDSWNSYINNGEPMTQIQRLFFKPIGESSNSEVLGGILCLWPDVNLARPEDAYTQNPVYPSMLTYAWTTWTADVQTASPTFFMTLPPRGTPAFGYFAAYEDILLHHGDEHFANAPFPYLKQTDKAWKVIGPFPGDKADARFDTIQDSYTLSGKEFNWQAATGNTLVMKDRFRLGGYFPEASAGETVYALTHIHSDRDRQVDTWIGFETPMRANRTYGGIPETGSWDANGGDIWLNDAPLPAPSWNNPGWKPARSTGWASPEDLEKPWTDEELYWTRKPTRVTLKQGWNKVLAKIPAATDYQNWMFTFAPLSMEGLRFAIRPDEHSTYYHQRKTHFESLPNDEGEIVLIGDSMTDGGEWAELLGNDKVKNRGISGDVTLGVLDRLEEVTASAPAKVFLLIGTNDLARGSSVEEVIQNISRIVVTTNEASPQTEVYVQSIFPVNDHYRMFAGHTGKGEEIKAINAALEKGVEGNYRYLDLHPSFTDDQQKLDIRYSNDGLHLNGAGYQRWASLLREYVVE
ncbi:lysophospholipase L1-like esterase [Lewinella aquimaris]|uniref:beta-N-acetylhexosaminidase n=1 Tax=Neolewinella aquimaris TaxID=1835722 RepID=A0A840E7T3_9BACT|nr:family 20 glycosylhydrolase [Neolewinella aquimaris]MBB4081090.1 lysophospholipase L1-like esterase [Neolewinella aquimaris]